MNITIHSGNWEELDVDALAVPMAKGGTVDAALDARLGGLPGELIDSGEFTGKAGACTLIHRVPDSAVKRVFLIGLGEAPVARHWFAAAGQAVRAAAKAKCRSVALLLPLDACARLTAEGAGFGQHRPSGYTEQKPWPVEEVVLLTTGDQAIADAGRITAECVNLARELVEIPANDLGPEEFAMRAAREGEAVLRVAAAGRRRRRGQRRRERERQRQLVVGRGVKRAVQSGSSAARRHDGPGPGVVKHKVCIYILRQALASTALTRATTKKHDLIERRD